MAVCIKGHFAAALASTLLFNFQVMAGTLLPLRGLFYEARMGTVFNSALPETDKGAEEMVL